MNIHRPFSVLFLITMTAGLLTAATDLAAGPLKVKSADPNSGVVGETHIVTIKGVGFTNANQVRFLVNKSNNDTGNVGVTELTEVDDETLTVKVNLNGATVADYDIEVQLSSGRKGKGTTLFTVQSKNVGGGTGSTLTATFCLNMWAEDPGLASDGGLASDKIHDYCHDRKERVQVETGSHPGFRFDSNTKSRPPLRWVQVNVPNDLVEVKDDSGEVVLSSFVSGAYQIDLRFNKANGGLDLGGMQYPSYPGEVVPPSLVPINVWLDEKDGNNRFGLAYSEDTDPLTSGHLAGNLCVRLNTLDAKVTRLGPGTWSIESNPDNAYACLWDLNADLSEQTGTLVQMPFSFVIEFK